MGSTGDALDGMGSALAVWRPYLEKPWSKLSARELVSHLTCVSLRSISLVTVMMGLGDELPCDCVVFFFVLFY